MFEELDVWSSSEFQVELCIVSKLVNFDARYFTWSGSLVSLDDSLVLGGGSIVVMSASAVINMGKSVVGTGRATIGWW